LRDVRFLAHFVALWKPLESQAVIVGQLLRPF
jgi:hypothetical protein